ncbi:MAG: CRISPR system precrRNA processing endoribonuclease RAMP protein Cas6 [bacterium]|nr:CRISPR system precrRNA processing endoribonuclease RAMP protein Cas6 [bacterium]
MLANFRIAKFIIVIRPKEYLSLPKYKGSTFRGGFGHAFRRISCAIKSKTCNECLLKEKCVYSYVFETFSPNDSETKKRYPNIPHPFIIEPPENEKLHYKEGEILKFGLVLIGKAIDYLPYFIYAFNELGNIGIGRAKGKYYLETVLGLDNENYTEIYNNKDKILDNSFKVIDHKTIEEECKRYKNIKSISLDFLTPLRIKHDNRLTNRLEFNVLITALMRRISLLSYFHCEQKLDVDIKEIIECAREIKVKESTLNWYDWERYSNRQDTRMKLGGLVGNITFEGEIATFFPYLVLGEYIHIGKNCSFGLGRYELNTPSGNKKDMSSLK